MLRLESDSVRDSGAMQATVYLLTPNALRPGKPAARIARRRPILRIPMPAHCVAAILSP